MSGFHQSINTQFGTFKLFCSDEFLYKIELNHTGTTANNPNKISEFAAQELRKYLEGKLKDFTVPVSFQTGTAFQKKVWKELLNIPYGTSISYLELSRKLGDIKAIRAVGAANGKNPIPIIVPCHRVIGSDGSLTGYASGVEMKRFLLKLEGTIPAELFDL